MLSLASLLPLLARYWWVAALAFLALYAGFEHHRVVSLLTERQALQSEVAQAVADAGRWKAASDQRDTALATLNAEVDQYRIDAAKANEAAQEAIDKNRQVQTDNVKLRAKMKELANAHPDQVNPLGGIAAQFADGLQP
jgi:chorismate mutase